MRLGIGLTALLLSAAVLGFSFTHPDVVPTYERPDYPYLKHKEPGEGARFYVSLDRKSIDARHKLRNVRVVIQIFDEGADPAIDDPIHAYSALPYEIEEDEAWGDTILVDSARKECNIGMDIRFEALPDDDEVYGKPARIVASGDVRYPVKLSGLDSHKFFEVDESFSVVDDFQFASRGEIAAYEQEINDYDACVEADRNCLRSRIWWGIREWNEYLSWAPLWWMTAAGLGFVGACCLGLHFRKRSRRPPDPGLNAEGSPTAASTRPF